MRKTTWLLTTLLAAAAAGCGDDGRSAGRSLAEQVDLARRFYGHAITLMSDPAYLDKATGLTYATTETVVLKDGSRYSGMVTRTQDGYQIKDRAGNVRNVPAAKVKTIIGYEKTSAEDVELPPLQADTRPVTQPPHGQKALELLDKARKIVSDALHKYPNAPAGIRGDAQLLLGQIGFDAGQYHRVRAERIRRQAARVRQRSGDLLVFARDRAILGEFKKALASMSPDKTLALQQAAAAEAQVLSNAAKATSAKISDLKSKIDQLAAENVPLRAQARDLRDRHERTSGDESCDLLNQAHKIELQVNANDSRADALGAQISRLTEDLHLQQEQLEGVQQKLDAMKARLGNVGAVTKDVAEAADKALAEAAGQFTQAAADAKHLLGLCKDLMAEEELTRKAMDGAAKDLAQAQSSIKSRRATKLAKRKAAPGRALDDPDDMHLASVVALKASANQYIADLLQGQLNTGKANAALAEDLTKIAEKLGQPVPAVVAELRKAHPADEPAARAQAIERYKSAEKDLGDILATQLKTGTGRNTRWIYQTRLADTYYGHFRLTGDQAALAQARKFVDEALEGKAQSPYLAPALNLKALLDRAQPAGQP